jgi:hypothetical protein
MTPSLFELELFYGSNQGETTYRKSEIRYLADAWKEIKEQQDVRGVV